MVTLRCSKSVCVSSRASKPFAEKLTRTSNDEQNVRHQVIVEHCCISLAHCWLCRLPIWVLRAGLVVRGQAQIQLTNWREQRRGRRAQWLVYNSLLLQDHRRREWTHRRWRVRQVTWGLRCKKKKKMTRTVVYKWFIIGANSLSSIIGCSKIIFGAKGTD